jgi:hypothetical protein
LIAQELLVEIDEIVVKLKSNEFKNANVNSVMYKLTLIETTIKNTQKRYLTETGEFHNNPVIPPISKMDAELQRMRNRKSKQNELLRNLENQNKKHQNNINQIKVMSNIELKKQRIRALINRLKKNIVNNN